jgi:uncharacterized OB-fold protein/acyl dehydratase
MGETLTERLQQFVGRPSGSPFRARDEVNQAMIRHWCDAVGDTNPVYTDPEAAGASRHGGVVAPPTMLQAWTMTGLSARPGGADDVQGALMGMLNGAGFTSVVATNCEQEYQRYLRPGDCLTATATIEAISDEKRTGLGDGHFVTTRTTFTDDRGEVVGTMLFRILKFRPKGNAAARPAAHRPRPAVNQDTEFFWDGVRAGELRVQRCAVCKALRHPPRPACPECQSLEWDWIVSSGRGTVYSFVVPHHPSLPAFGSTPYVVALVELDEGTRFVTNVIDCEPADVVVGMPVELVMTPVDDDLILPLFRPATASAS